jgi:hypothetical protein
VRGVTRDEQFGLRLRHSRSLHVARLVERITRNIGKNGLKGAVFLIVAKAFDTVLIDGLLYKLTLLTFPSYIVLTISSYLRGWTFEASFQTATSSCRGMRPRVAQGKISLPCPLQSVRQRHDLTLAPRRVSYLRDCHGHQSHVPKSDAARHLPRVIPQRPSTVVERMKNRH